MMQSFWAEVDHDECICGCRVNLGDALERRDCNDGELWNMAAEFFVCRGYQEHVPGKMAVPCILGDYPDGHTVRRVGAGITILDEDVPALEKSLKPIDEIVKFLRMVRPVVLTPPDVLFGGRFLDDKLVVGRTGRMFSGINDNRTVAGYPRLPAERDLFVERLRRQIPVRHPEICQTMILQAEVTFCGTCFTLSRSLDIEEIIHSQSRVSFRSPM